MEPHSKSSDASLPVSVDSDSALGTMSDISPEEESPREATTSIASLKAEVKPEEGADVSDSELVVSAGLQFNLTPSNVPECNGQLKEAEELRRLSPSPGGVPIQVTHHKGQSVPHQTEGEFSGSDGDIEDNTADEGPVSETMSLPQVAASSMKLPETVTHLTTEEGSDVYLVGTVHFSKESQDDVSNTIKMVRPDIVVVELCASRNGVLLLDEETILNESKSLNFNKMRVIIRQHGKVHGLLYLLMLSVSAHVTKQLGMAPGGEFRAAFSEVRRSVPNCLIHLGDRPINITLSRALAPLSVWQKMKLMWNILASKEPISKEEVEKCKQKDFIVQILADMTGQFPTISEVFVKERDIYLTKSLQTAAQAIPDPLSRTGFRLRVVVGVVGIGHVPGITEHWGKITDEDIPPIMIIPPPNFSDRAFKFAFKYGFYGLVGFGLYKCIPSSAKSVAFAAIEKNINTVSEYFAK